MLATPIGQRENVQSAVSAEIQHVATVPEQSQCKPWNGWLERKKMLTRSSQDSQDSELSIVSYANDSFASQPLKFLAL